MQFKATAVRLSELRDVRVQDVAEALDIHPFMLSRWRKHAREGLIVTKWVKLDTETSAELKRLRELERKYKLLKEEHELLKKPSGLLPIKSGNLRLHRSKPGKPPNSPDVPPVRRHPRRLLRLAPTPSGRTCAGRRSTG
ncbi:MAG: transposase [Sulfuritalea sp.]|nr:transposase [Sulfuritalea sp.]